jgi:peptide/nickel transport system substrate-binding protein
MNRRRALIFVLIAFVFTVSAVACGRTRSEGGEGGEGSGTAGGPTAVTENQLNAMPRDRIEDGGQLVWPISSMPANYNYAHVDAADRDTVEILMAMMPRPFLTDAAGVPTWNPDYLAAEPVLVTEPKQVVTYQIHPKAIWYDGTPITWQDFHWHWRALNGTDKSYQIRGSTGYADIETVARGRDDREVIVTFKNKYADWPSLFYALLPVSTTKTAQAFNTAWKDRPFTTAGPFKIATIDQTAKTVTIVRNEKWWGPPAKLDTILFRTIDLDAQIDALANGEIDLMDIGPDVNKYTRARGISGADIRWAAGPNFRHITINGTGPILRDVKVRQALAMGIDRAAIARAMLGPLGIDNTTLGNHIFMRNQTGYRDNSGDVGKYDPGRAAQLLDEAGWRLDGKVRKKDGRTLEINFVIPSAVATSRQESELIQNMLGQVGVTVNINTVPSPDFFENYIRTGQFDFTVFSWIGTPYPISSSRALYAKPTAGPNGELAIQQNYSRVGSDEIDKLFAEATQELDRQKAIDLANRIDALIWQEVHSLTQYQRPDMWVTKNRLANHGAFGFAEIVYNDIGWAKQ